MDAPNSGETAHIHLSKIIKDKHGGENKKYNKNSNYNDKENFFGRTLSDVNGHASNQKTPKPPEAAQQKLQPKILNLSSVTLTQSHLKLLSHGTKFTPIAKGNYFDAKRCTEEFTEKLKKKFIYHNSDYTDNSLVRKKSTRQTNCKDEEMKQTIRTIDTLEPDKSSNKDNLTPDERECSSGLAQWPTYYYKRSRQRRSFSYYEQRILRKYANPC